MTITEIYRPSLWFQLLLASVVGLLVCNTFTYAEDTEDWMPDPNLRHAISEKLGIETLTITDMQRLYDFVADGKFKADLREIQSLKGLEHAINLEFLAIVHTKVSDLMPLTGLENLRVLKLDSNRITDITSLAGLINLEVLQLQNNQIEDISLVAGLVKLQKLNLEDNLLTDISPLQGLGNLKTLHLGGNQIVDITPLAELVNLNVLTLENNQILDFTPIYRLVGIELLTLGEMPIDSEVLEILNPIDRPFICHIEGEPILPRIKNREYPSIFQACGDIINLPGLSWEERLPYHDLFFCQPIFGVKWTQTPDGMKFVVIPEEIRRRRKEISDRNPNMLLLADIEYYASGRYPFPEDSLYWLRDDSGNRIEVQDWNQFVLDFRHPDVQDMVIQQARAIVECGVFDGIGLDHWVSAPEERAGYKPPYKELSIARDRIIQGIRDAVGEDFLILVNAADRKIPRHAAYINGIFMETQTGPDGTYSHELLSHIESTLLWAEENLREPQINCLEGRRVGNKEPMDSPKNLQWMRLWTTMSLTHSDGYVLFNMGGEHNHSHTGDELTFEFRPGHVDDHAQGTPHTHTKNHYWYDFWDANLGRPIGGDETKGQLYENREGLFIREFTNGWAVYNRSGTATGDRTSTRGFRLVERCGASTPAYVGGFRWRNLFEGEIGVENPSYGGCQRGWCCQYPGFSCSGKCLWQSSTRS